MDPDAIGGGGGAAGPSDAGAGPSLLFADENPGLLLTRDGRRHVAASLWRSSCSTAGGGHVLALACALAGQGPQAWVMTDNPELAAVVVPTFLDHWALFDDVDLTDLTPVPARFGVAIAPTSWTVTASGSSGGGREVRLAWHDLSPATTHPVHGHDGVHWLGRPLLVDHHVRLAARVEVVLDAEPVHLGAEVSTAYVTLAETWVHPHDGTRGPAR